MVGYRGDREEGVSDADDPAVPLPRSCANAPWISASLPQGAEITVAPSICSAAWAECRYPSAKGAVSGLNRSEIRATSGAASFNNASHLPPTEGSKVGSPVRLPPGRPRFCTILSRSDRQPARRQLEGRVHQSGRGRRRADDYKIGMRGDNFVCDSAHPGGLSARPMIVQVTFRPGLQPVLSARPRRRRPPLSACIIVFSPPSNTVTRRICSRCWARGRAATLLPHYRAEI